ncbi:MAG TPA: MBL fold metallo-hydrolase RNA specificity domain-containing protein, partial [Aminivibrio sp.]|nr:MBL fold metallo-hydrolase RNA specificity domain-containing protein [Aminivibrio sp.]
RSFTGTVTFVDPIVDPKTRVARARVEVADPKGTMRPGMFATGTVQLERSRGDSGIVVPKSAVLWTGERSVVYVKDPGAEQGSFRLREVTLGPSLGEHQVITLTEKDVVAIFATPIPGNEKTVSNTINRLFACGCEVVYEKEQAIHVSGHAAQDELRVMLNMVRPQFFVPVHGEYRHLVRHAKLAREMGVAPKNAFVLLNGDVLTLEKEKAVVKDRVQAGGIMVDGIALGEMQGSVLKERRELAEDGAVAVSLILTGEGTLASPPVFESRGFLHLEDAAKLREDLTVSVGKAVESLGAKAVSDRDLLETRIKGRMRDALRRFGRGRPVILPLVTVLGEKPAAERPRASSQGRGRRRKS